MVSPSQNTRLSLARLTCLLLGLLAALVLVAYVPQSIEGMYTDWQVLSSHPAVKALLPYQVYATTVWSLRYLAVTIFWLAAVLIYVEVGLRNSSFTWMGLYTALLLACLPPALLTGQVSAQPALPAPWDAMLSITSQLVVMLGLVGYLLFYYIFPDGSFAPRWMRWFSLLVGIAAFALLTISTSGLVQAEWIWLAGILTLLTGVLFGIASQLYRYRRMTAPEDRSQTSPVVLALVLLLLAFIAPAMLGNSPWAGLSGIFLTIILLTLLPLALCYVMLRRNLWQVDLQPQHKRRYAILAAALAFVWISGTALASQRVSGGNAGAISFEPLPASENPRPVIIDTDMAPDDWMAILYLLQRPEIRIVAITVAGTGETHCEPGVRNALGLVALAGESNIPVACGSETPLEGEHVFPEGWRERADSMQGLTLPEGSNPTPGGDAIELLSDTLLNSPEKVTLLALGPLTNLAAAFEHLPAIIENIEQVYIMGGALEVLGNVGFSGAGIENQVAEWNIYIDPLAAQRVFASGAPITLVPLDATNDAPVNLDFYFSLQANHNTPEAEFVYRVLSDQLDFIASGGYYFWDPLAAALLVDESLGTIREGAVKVYTAEGPSSGLTRLQAGGDAVRYAKSVEAEAFEADFLRTLNQP
jgi:pyrimidine-specific ribonucleoside hydrolase